jgi:hypothetical protein
MIEILLVVFIGLSAYLFWRLQTQEPEEKVVYKKAKAKHKRNLSDSAIEIFSHIAHYTYGQNTKINFHIEENLSYDPPMHDITFFATNNGNLDNKSWWKMLGMGANVADVMTLIKKDSDKGSHLVVVNGLESRCFLVDKSGTVKGEIVATEDDCYYEETAHE